MSGPSFFALTLGRAARARRASSRARARPPASARGVAACGLKDAGGSDVGLLVCDAPEAVSAARFTRSGVLAAPGPALPRALRGSTGSAPWWPTRATPTRPPASAGWTRPRTQGAGAAAAGVPRDQVAVASTGVIGVPLDASGWCAGSREAHGALRARGRRRLRRGDPHHRRVPQARHPRGRAERRHRALCAQAKGAGMISPAFATMLCFVQTDAVLLPETAELLLGVCVMRSFDRISVDGQLSTNDTAAHGLQAPAACGSSPRARRAALRGGAGRPAARLALRSCATARAPRAWAAWWCTAATARGGAAARARSANSPLVKTALHGGDPNWGRIAQAVGMALPGTAPLQSTSRSRAARCAPRAPPSPPTATAWSPRSRRRGRVRARPARRGRGDRGLLLRPLPRVRRDQRGVHDVKTAPRASSAPSSRPSRTSVSSTGAPW